MSAREQHCYLNTNKRTDHIVHAYGFYYIMLQYDE